MHDNDWTTQECMQTHKLRRELMLGDEWATCVIYSKRRTSIQLHRHIAERVGGGAKGHQGIMHVPGE